MGEQMHYTLLLDGLHGYEFAAEFVGAEGLEGELQRWGGHPGRFLSFRSGRLSPELERVVADLTRQGARQLGNGELRFHGVEPTRGMHLGPLRLVAAPNVDGASVQRLVFETPHFEPLPPHAQGVWEAWASKPPRLSGRWRRLDVEHRRATLFVTRFVHEPEANRPTLPVRWTLDGRLAEDEPGLFLSLGESALGVGGYLGACLDGLADRLIDFDRAPGGSTLVWAHSSASAHALGRVFSESVALLEGHGVRVVLR